MTSSHNAPAELKDKADNLLKDYRLLETSYNLDEKKYSLKTLEADSTDPDLWNDPAKAKDLMLKIGDLKSEIDEFSRLNEGVAVLSEIVNAGENLDGWQKEIEDLLKLLAKLKLKSFLSGPYDRKNAIVTIHAGQGGVEAMDWASMLYRMYLRFIEKRGWESEGLDYSEGEEAGIKSVTFKVLAPYAYGYLKGEAGTHRLVRQSPFNADNLRQTSFALVGVMPEISETELTDIKIKDDDLEWQFFRSSSKGGQNVQKVSTAVRVKHVPTGIFATAQTERFQEQNRKIALELLRARLWLLSKEQKSRQINEIKGEFKPASWGNQIRNYVLHPYKMVKDLRTKIESSNPESVLDGNLEEFIEANLVNKVD